MSGRWYDSSYAECVTASTVLLFPILENDSHGTFLNCFQSQDVAVLTRLRLGNNGFDSSDLPDFVFVALVALTRLELNRNDLTLIRSDMLAGIVH